VQIASSVEKRTAFALPVFRIDRFATGNVDARRELGQRHSASVQQFIEADDDPYFKRSLRGRRASE